MDKIGLQLYSIRDVTPRDAAGLREIFASLSDFGYDQIEPAGLPVDAQTFADLAGEAGLEIVNTHYDLTEILEAPEKAMRVHEILGTRNIGVGGVGLWTKPEEVEAFIEKANRSAKIFAREGFRFIYHNHSHEFLRMEDGRRPYDMLLSELDPDGTAMELDCYWAQNAGLDVAQYIRDHADRIRLIHLKDMGVRVSGQTGWTESFITEVGHGNMNYDGVVRAAEESGVEGFVVEQDANWVGGDPLAAVGMSCRYIREKWMR